MEYCTLFENGYSPWKLVVASDAAPAVKHAADELACYFEKITGFALPRIDETACPAGYEIVLAGARRVPKFYPVNDVNTPITEAYAARQAELEAFLAGLAPEEVWYSIGEKRVDIAGGSPRGTLYAAYEFLERELGCRWFAPECEKIPRRSLVRLPLRSHRFAPPLEYRDVFYYKAIHSADWSARNRSNGGHAPLNETHGGAVRWAGFVHTFLALVPPEKYGAEHPEYYSMMENGERSVGRGKRAQLCLSNPEVLKIAVESVRSWLRENPDATIVSVSQMDGTTPETMLYCRCEKCRAVDEHEGSPAGSIVHFVNAVADAIRDEFPHVFIDTLAYAYSTRAPEHVTARDNVIIRPCFRDPGELERWYRVCSHMFIWDYVTNFRHYSLTFPNYDTIAPNIRSLISSHITGIFAQGVYETPGLDFEELKEYLFARLLWNPDADTEELICEFMPAYYGSAAAPLKRYIDRLRRIVREKKLTLQCFCNLPVPYVTTATIAAGNEAFDEAERLADSDEILRRVRCARLSLRFMELMYTPKDAPGRDAEIDRFFDDADRLGVLLVSERNKPEEAKLRMKQMIGHYELSSEIPDGSDLPDEI